MKKITLVLIFCLAISNVANATCWGTVVQGKNGHSYCVSKQYLDWYGSLGWCVAQGRHLASINEACDFGTQIYGQNTNDCPNSTFNSGVYFDENGNDVRGTATWTATIDSGNSIFVIAIGTGGKDTRGHLHWRGNKRDNKALCY
jgi:hypothetical protein